VTATSWRWHGGGVLVFGLLVVACARPSPKPPPQIPPPPDARQQRFTSALFSVYHSARVASGDARKSERFVPIRQAAAIVAEDAKRYGDVWRVLAITQLAAADLDGFRQAIVTLARKKEAPRTLRRLLKKHPRADLGERERIVYEFLLGPETFLDLSPTSQPDCPSKYPTVDPTHGSGVATATMSVWVQDPLDDLASNMDPQNWDNACGSLLFNAAYLTDLKCNGTFDIDPATYNARPAMPSPEGQTWGPRYLFEHFLPGVGSNFFKNLLSVETKRETDSFSIKFYDLEMSIRSRIAPDAERDGGLLEDSGDASALQTSSPWTLVQVSKTVRFDTFPSHTPDELADDAATTLKIMGTGLAYWACCPQ
jgi:hypothetical protein